MNHDDHLRNLPKVAEVLVNYLKRAVALYVCALLLENVWNYLDFDCIAVRGCCGMEYKGPHEARTLPNKAIYR